MARGEIHVELSVSYADDPKIAALARWPRDARGARDLYVQMICYAKQNLTDGFVPAENLGKLVYPDSPAVAARQVEMLSVVGLVAVVDTGWLIGGFLKRNMSRAQVLELSAARSEFGRIGGKRSGEVRRASSKTEANVKQPASVCLNTESESETETKAEVPTAPVTTSRRARPLNDFELTDGMRVWARNEEPTVDVDRETAKFVDHFTASGRPMKDWTAAWRNWIRNSTSRTVVPAQRPLRAVGSTTDQRVGETLALAERFREEGQ